MPKLLFQLPTAHADLSEESRINAAYAMLGVVAIMAIISLVFLFQHIMVTPSFGEPSGFVVYKADQLCDAPNGLIVTDDALARNLRSTQGYACTHTNQPTAWCCYPSP